MSYRIVNKNNRYLSAFHFNGGWEIKDVFPCSKYSWIIFDNKKNAEDYLSYMLETCIKQKERWGEWLNTALQFLKTLRIRRLL